MRNRSTLDFLTTWEQIYNPNFKVFESEHFRKQVGLLTFTPSVTEWCERTNAIGIYSKMGKYGGTYAYKDIAFEFASAISPVFKLYLIKEFERLKELENENREWDIKRILTKNNYLIHTAELIKEGKSKEERLEILNEIAKYQLNILNNAEKIKLLVNGKEGEKNE